MRIHCKYTGIKGILTVYRDALRFRYMITPHALRRAKILAHWEIYGIDSTMDAFEVSRRTLFNWKKRFADGGKTFEALNPVSRTPKTTRKRHWDARILNEIKRIRRKEPNLGPAKIYSPLKKFCAREALRCPKPTTIKRLIKDMGGLRRAPETVSHFGKITPRATTPVTRKPKHFKALYPGHCVALDTVEKHIHGTRRYVITFEDLYTRFSFAWGTNSHASKAAEAFFDRCRMVFPFQMMHVLTDNGSEFKKHFAARVNELHLTHYHTYPKTPKMNAHIERFNRTIQEQFVNYHLGTLCTDVDAFNRKLVDWLIFYNTERVHCAFDNKMTPVEFMVSLAETSSPNTTAQKCNYGWPYTPI